MSTSSGIVDSSSATVPQVNEAKADSLEEKADVVRAEGEVKAEKQEAADEAAGKTAPDAPVPATATTEKK